MNNLTKIEGYAELQRSLLSIIENESNRIAILANTSAFLFEHLPDVNWVGFYLLENDELILGPFQGKVACMRIPIGKGICGTAVLQNKIQRIDNVHNFVGHIACDAASNAEIVLPLVVADKIIGVLDIDSTNYSRFDSYDEQALSSIVSSICEQLAP